MKKIIAAAVPLLVLIATAWMLYSYEKSKQAAWNRIKNPETVRMLKHFVAVKKAQAYASTNILPSEIRATFKYAERGDWLALSNSVQNVQEQSRYWYSLHNGYQARRSAIENLKRAFQEKFMYYKPPFRLQGTPGETVMEVYGAFDGFMTGDEKYAAKFGREVIDSITTGSIYFGGTDPGRFIVTAMQKSQVNGDPFFTLTQNALADGSYLDYLRSMYESKIYIPTDQDVQNAFNIGETFTRTNQSPNFQWMIEGLLLKTIFQNNSNREFFVEDSVPLDWMYPYLEPHGLIMRLNRQPLSELSGEIVRRDHDYWTKTVTPMIGDWLKPDTTVKEVAAFAEKVFARHDFSGFAGDPQFVQNDYSCKIFSKERCSIAGLYGWRAQHATDAAEKKRMNAEADFAFRQAFALCPHSPEVVFRYANLLMSESRISDALLMAETAAKMPEMKGSDGEQIRALPGRLRQVLQQTHGAK
jgi:hypothetical protein